MNNIIKGLLLCLALMVLAGCEKEKAPTGSIEVRLVWPSPAELQIRNAPGYYTRSGLPTTARTIRVRIIAPDMNTLQKDFAASAHRGKIENVPAGNNRTLTVQALNGSDDIVASCEMRDLLIETGKITQAGDCVLKVVGGSGQQPAVIEPKMAELSASCFDMGSPDTEKERNTDEVLQNVCVDAFNIGEYEVTNGEYVAFLNSQGRSSDRKNEPWLDVKSEDGKSHIFKEGDIYKVEAGFEQHPMIKVSWFGAAAYAEWLSKETGKQYRLPTEAEWEYAARAGTKTRYSWGDEDPVCQKDAKNGAKFDDDADCHDTGTESIGFSAANPWRLYDVHGNVWEWTCSKYVSRYDGSEMGCASKNDVNSSRVLRGGSWGNGSGNLRSAARFQKPMADRVSNDGFRLAEDP